MIIESPDRLHGVEFPSIADKLNQSDEAYAEKVSINDNNMHMHMNRNKYSHDLFLGISTISLITHEMEITITNHRGQEQEEGLTNYTKRSDADTIRMAGATGLTEVFMGPKKSKK